MLTGFSWIVLRDVYSPLETNSGCFCDFSFALRRHFVHWVSINLRSTLPGHVSHNFMSSDSFGYPRGLKQIPEVQHSSIDFQDDPRDRSQPGGQAPKFAASQSNDI